MLGWILQNSYGKRTKRWFSHVITYRRSSKYKYRFLLHFVFFEAIKVFIRTLKGMYLIFRSIFDKMNTIEQKLRSISVRMSIISIWMCFTRVSDLIRLGMGTHLYTYVQTKLKTKQKWTRTSLPCKWSYHCGLQTYSN